LSEGTFFNERGSVDDFVLPGDDERLARIEEPVAEEPAAEPESEPEAAPEPEPETPEAEPEEAAAAEPELILGKFKSQEELAAAYRELEAFQGRQSGELGELRRALEERLGAMEQQASAPASWDDLIDQNPAAAARLAYQHGETLHLQRAVAAWEEMSPGSPQLWADNLTMRAELEERLGRAEQALGPVQAQANNGMLQGGVAKLVEQYPEVGEFIQTAEFSELAAQIPLARKALIEGTPDEQLSAIETVYLIHRGRASDNLKDAVRDVARTAAEEAQTIREEAFVASATATTDAPKRSRADEYAEGWDETDKVFASGWHVDGLGPNKG